jgi:Tol biopolymer transport system component
LRFAITDTATGETTRVAPPDGFGWTGGSEGAFSPDGSLVVLPVSHDPRGIRSHNDALALVDVSSGTAELVPGTTELDSQYRAMTWSPDGQRLYFVADPATIRSYRLGASDSRNVASVPVGRGNVLQMVAVPREQ